MATHAHPSGYALHDQKMVSSRGIVLLTVMYATFAIVIAVSFAMASRISPSGRPTAPATVEPTATD